MCRSSGGPHLGPLASGEWPGRAMWGTQTDEIHAPTRKTYPCNSSVAAE